MSNTIRVQIYPEGIIKPSIINITYSNYYDPVDYVSHPDYRRSPAYVTIPISNLTAEPYNSFIRITYSINSTITNWLLKPIFIKDEFVPIFSQ